MIAFHELALSEARNVQSWYAIRSRQAALNFHDQLQAAVARIEESSERFPIIRKRYQYARVFGFPYIVVFRRRPDETVMVVAIAHSSRKSGYWSKRD